MFEKIKIFLRWLFLDEETVFPEGTTAVEGQAPLRIWAERHNLKLEDKENPEVKKMIIVGECSVPNLPICQVLYYIPLETSD